MKKLLTFLIRKRCYKAVLVFFFCVNGQVGYAQLSFSIYGELSGNCSDLDKGLVNAYIKSYQSRITSIPTLQDCERMRQRIGGITVTADGCTYRIVCTPCVGRAISTSSSSANTPLNSNVLGPNQGTTYFYTNQANEIRQWQEDSDRLLGIIGNKGVSVGLTHVETGDDDFDDALMKDMYILKEGSTVNITPKGRGISLGVQSHYKKVEDIGGNSFVKVLNENENKKYVSDFIQNYYEYPKDLGMALSDLYYKITNIDINEIWNKTFYDEEDIQRLEQYNDLVSYICENMIQGVKVIKKALDKDAIDMAFYAADVYNPSSESISSTDGILLRDLNILSDSKEKLGAKQIIDKITQLNTSTAGFQAAVYYDEIKEHYIVAMRGTQVELNKEGYRDIKADISQVLVGSSEQYEKAMELADAILKSGIPLDKIKITGHSLGGGLAVVIGLKTGCKTFTYNQSHLTQEQAKKLHLTYENANVITNYISSEEKVIKILEPVGKSVRHQVNSMNFVKDLVGNYKNMGNPYLKIGKEVLVENGGSHEINDIRNALINQSDVQQNWSRINNIQYDIQKQINSGSLFKRSSINIIENE